jgi:hypothetical protein
MTAFRICAFLQVAVAVPALTFGQSRVEGGPLTGPPVTDSPFSADATTIVRQTLGDGTRIEHRGTARYYRDAIGRVRVEQTIIGLDALKSGTEAQVRITVYPDPTKGSAYTLDPVAKTAALGPRSIAGLVVGGGNTFAVPLGGSRFLVFDRGDRLRARYRLGDAVTREESLGTRHVAGLEVTGRRLTTTIPVGQLGNDRPMQIVDERWESAELKIVVYSRHSDPRTGVVEYQLTNVLRAEPPADLFLVPPNYTIRGSSDWITLEYAAPAPGEKRPIRKQ